MVDRGLADAKDLAEWFRKKRAMCDTSLMLVNENPGTYQEHLDRCCDGLLHTRQNCRVVCLCFASAYNLSREQWLTLLLRQDLVPLTEHEGTIVRAELEATAAGGKMTRKHMDRTLGENGVAATADDNFFAR